MTGNLEAVFGGVGIIVFTLVFIAGLMFMMGILTNNDDTQAFVTPAGRPLMQRPATPRSPSREG